MRGNEENNQMLKQKFSQLRIKPISSTSNNLFSQQQQNDEMKQQKKKQS